MHKLFTLLGCLLLLPLSVHAENSTKANGYTIHHNAITTESLPPKVASAYKIQRSKGRALINVSIIKDKAGTTGTPVTANITMKARNLIGQVREIPLREIHEDTAIYYIADFPVGNREKLMFDLEVTPKGETYALQASFQQEFFTN